MAKPKILLQIDPDPHPSSFDSIVAIDAGVERLLTFSNVAPEELEGIVHGAMFTRGPNDLQNTAIFFGGRSVESAERLVAIAKHCFFGPVRVSLMVDPNGANTTAAAAMACAERHLDFADTTTAILGASGPVGQRLVQLIANNASPASPPTIRVCSRQHEKAKAICARLQETTAARLVPFQTATPQESLAATSDADALFSAGAAGIELLPEQWLATPHRPRVAIDLNAVPPNGISGIDAMDTGNECNGTTCYGAIGVGNLKMKVHRRSIQELYVSNDQVLELVEIYRLAKTLA